MSKLLIFIAIFIIGLCCGLYFNFAVDRGRYQLSLFYLESYQATHQMYADNPHLITWNSSEEQELELVEQYQYIIDTMENK